MKASPICFTALIFAILLAPLALPAQAPAPKASLTKRQYKEGEKIACHMTGVNEDWHYTADAEAVVKKNTAGNYVEEFKWVSRTSEGKALAIPPAMADFRQTLSLDPNWMPSGFDMHGVDQAMVGPVTDLMTFYVDLWLFAKIGFLQHAGDHFYVPNPQTSSWADGTRVLVGEDHIDFDLKVESVDPVKQTAVVVVHHVSPAHPKVKLTAAWMQEPVAGSPNNWVEVTKTGEQKFRAEVGKETFDVTLTVSLVDGKILSAVMENPVVTIGRDCTDAALTQCGDSQPHTIHRHIEIACQP